jgi:hypothetical protein
MFLTWKRLGQPWPCAVASIALLALLFAACGKTKPKAGLPDGAAGRGGADGGTEVGIDAAGGSETSEVGADVGAETADGDARDATQASDGADGPNLDMGATDGDAGATVCAEPASCPPADDTKTPVISCLAPSTVQAGHAFRLNIYGQFLHVGDVGGFSLVTFDNGVPLNGALVTPCHVTVDVGASVLPVAKSVKVVVSPGGRAGQSQPATLTVQ